MLLIKQLYTIFPYSIITKSNRFYITLIFAKQIMANHGWNIILKHPLSSVKEINERQQLLKRIIEVHEEWPATISNGSVLMIEKFYESQVGNIPSHANIVNSNFYKIFNAGDYSLVKYSVSHFIDFLQGMSKIYDLLYKENNPAALDVMLQRIKILLNKPIAQQIIQYKKSKQLSKQTVLHFGFFIRNHYKQDAQDLIEIYSRLDAFYSMATACT